MVLIFGGFSISKKVESVNYFQVSIQERYKNAEPYIRGLKDLSDPEKCYAYHPFVIGEYVRNDILDWRSDISRRLNSRLRALKRQVITTKVKSDIKIIEYELGMQILIFRVY